MEPAAVIKDFDVFKSDKLCLLSGLWNWQRIKLFTLEALKEILSHSVVIRVAAHALADIMEF